MFDIYEIYGTAYPIGSAFRDNMTIYYHDDGNFYVYMAGGPLIRCGPPRVFLMDYVTRTIIVTGKI